VILGTELQLVLHTSPYCPSCPVTHLCHEQNTARGCWPEGPQHPNLLHPTKRDFRERITEVNGFDFDDIQAIDLKTPPIPRYVPRIRIGAGIGGYDLVAAVGIALREVERLAANVRLRGRPAKEILGIPPGHALIVLGFEKDSFLEDAWRPERRRSVLEAMRDVQPDLAVAWGFSVWYRHADGWVYPRAEQLYSIKRSLVTFANLQQLGIPAIPHIYWGDAEDLDRWARWLAANPTVSMIAVDLQTADSCADWSLALRGLAYLRTKARRDLHLLANGPCALPRIRDLDKVWPGCSVTNFGAYFAAFFRYKRRYGLQAWWADDDVSRQVIFQDAVSQYSTFLRRPDRPDRPVFYGTATPYRRESFESLPIVQPEGVGTARPVDAVQLRLPILDVRRTPSMVGV
jgi:hypothetical protein